MLISNHVQAIDKMKYSVNMIHVLHIFQSKFDCTETSTVVKQARVVFVETPV